MAPLRGFMHRSNWRLQTAIGYEGLFSRYRFEQLDIHPKLLSALKIMGIDTATEVQARAFVPLSMGRDLIINAETGSGKTLSYLLPIFNRIYFLTDAPAEGKVGGRAQKAVLPPPTVIVCPTYDLCAQSLVKVPQFYPIAFTNTSRRRSVPQTPTPGSGAQPFDDTHLGGDSVIHQERPEHLPQATAGLHEHYWSPRIRWGAVDIVVTTPHHFAADLDRCAETGGSAQLHPAAVIFDEADMIFHEMRSQVYDIVHHLRPRLEIPQQGEAAAMKKRKKLLPCQFVFASASMPTGGPNSVAAMISQRFCTAEMVTTSFAHSIPPSLKVEWFKASPVWDQRCAELAEILKAYFPASQPARILVFVNSSLNCNALYHYLRDLGWPVVRFSASRGAKLMLRLARDADQFCSASAYHDPASVKWDGKVDNEKELTAVEADALAKKRKHYAALMQSPLRVMVCTDHAARGFDWPQVDAVIHFQMPLDAVKFLHRSGRGGRLGRPCRIITLVGQKDETLATEIQQQIDKGRSLEKVFSRKQSLPRKRRRRAELQEGIQQVPAPVESPSDELGPKGVEPVEEPQETEDKGTLVGYVSVYDSDSDGDAEDDGRKEQDVGFDIRGRSAAAAPAAGTNVPAWRVGTRRAFPNTQADSDSDDEPDSCTWARVRRGSIAAAAGETVIGVESQSGRAGRQRRRDKFKQTTLINEFRRNEDEVLKL
ncbi:hypothetical protein FOZ62_007358 [Perkinsus olseni]|uniref:ATP-dependent RNA helicase n=1 Tax=Perkinsus olseni TaxID=32597 RepID=A0A7J6TKC5_PEROL|nr:hypothetical protein FOZ62_007358 [Perkinsus olseni]